MPTNLERLLEKYPDLQVCVREIQKALDLLTTSFQHGGKLLLCGNGGSAADSEHIVGELMKGYLSNRALDVATREKLIQAFPSDGAYLADHLQGALPAISLVSQTSLLTAFANDVAPDMIFAQQVYGYGHAGDALIGISTSGKSKNVIYALQVAKTMGLATIGFTGQSGGRMRELCDAAICVPSQITADIQERHLAMYHALCAALEEAFFPQTSGSIGV